MYWWLRWANMSYAGCWLEFPLGVMPWTTGFHSGRSPRQTTVDPISLDMSGNGRFRPLADLLPADQDTAPAIQLGHFTWQTTTAHRE